MVTRRAFLGMVVGWAGSVLATPTNLAVRADPSWLTVPNITFTPGVPGRVDVSQYAIGAARITARGTLPAGVTFDGTAFVYDGRLPSGTSPAITLLATSP